MTRINIVPVKELMDQHLIAEYREITMVPGSLNRTLTSKKGLDYKKIADEFTLNSGHVYFFYDKGKYLHDRYDLIINEIRVASFLLRFLKIMVYIMIGFHQLMHILLLENVLKKE